MLDILSKPNRQKDIESVSPHLATSALESFHALATYYSPKEKFYDEKSYVLRSKLATLHWNNLQFEEMEGSRTLARKVPFWCKTKKQIVYKLRKTDGKNEWRHDIVRLVLSSERNRDGTHFYDDDIAIEIRAEAEEQLYRTPL